MRRRKNRVEVSFFERDYGFDIESKEVNLGRKLEKDSFEKSMAIRAAVSAEPLDVISTQVAATFKRSSISMGMERVMAEHSDGRRWLNNFDSYCYRVFGMEVPLSFSLKLVKIGSKAIGDLEYRLRPKSGMSPRSRRGVLERDPEEAAFVIMGLPVSLADGMIIPNVNIRRVAVTQQGKEMTYDLNCYDKKGKLKHKNGLLLGTLEAGEVSGAESFRGLFPILHYLEIDYPLRSDLIEEYNAFRIRVKLTPPKIKK